MSAHPRRDASRDVVLSVNCGSSSLKFGLFSVSKDDAPLTLATGAVERIGAAAGEAWLRAGDDSRRVHEGAYPDHVAALDAAFALLEDAGTPSPTIVGHRVVHGGARHVAPERVTGALVRSLHELASLAPLHTPPALSGIAAVTARRPELPQVACFDTAFHATLPEVARRLPLPDALDAEGVRRYGFHGLSYEYVLGALAPDIPARVVIAHLGSGASLVAVKDGKAVDTTMGFTPAGGVVMGTRSGDVDPGLIVYLLREKKLSVDAVERLFEREAGLLAVGGSSDVEALVTRAPDDERARRALALFAYSVRKALGGLVAAMGGIDALVFTGGIGEHAASVRAAICEGLEVFGIRLSAARNARADAIVSADDSATIVRVIATDEDQVIARHAYRVACRA